MDGRIAGGTEQSLRQGAGVCGGKQEALWEIRRGGCRQKEEVPGAGRRMRESGSRVEEKTGGRRLTAE